MPEPLSSLETALLQVFRRTGARTGDPVPASVLRQNIVYGGGPAAASDIESALFNLQFRGLIAPGPGPLSGTSWVLTISGYATANLGRSGQP